MTLNARQDGNQRITIIAPDGNSEVDVVATGGKWRMAVDALVTVEEIFGQDDYADTWFFVTNAGATNDTLTIDIDQTAYPPAFNKVITRQAGQDIYTFAQYIVAELNADANFSPYWAAKYLNNIVFVISRIIAEKGESPGLSPDAFTVVPTGTITVNVPAGNGEIVRRKKSTFLSPHPQDNRLGILGVRGEVTSIQRADNPIHANVKAIESAPSFKKIFERYAENNFVEYFLQFAMGSQLGSEFEVYKIEEQDRIENYTGVTGTDILLDNQAVSSITGYITHVKKNGTPTTAYTIAESTYPDKSILRMNVALVPSDTIEIKYDAMERVCNLWCQKENSIVYPLPAPVKVEYGQGMLALYLNHSANSGTITFNVNGYIIDANEVFL